MRCKPNIILSLVLILIGAARRAIIATLLAHHLTGDGRYSSKRLQPSIQALQALQKLQAWLGLGCIAGTAPLAGGTTHAFAWFALHP